MTCLGFELMQTVNLMNQPPPRPGRAGSPAPYLLPTPCSESPSCLEASGSPGWWGGVPLHGVWGVQAQGILNSFLTTHWFSFPPVPSRMT